jgi:hypothetical protein
MEFDFDVLEKESRYKLLCAFVVPRPIALVTTVSTDGIPNAAPFSFFNVFGDESIGLAEAIFALRQTAGDPQYKRLDLIVAISQDGIGKSTNCHYRCVGREFSAGRRSRSKSSTNNWLRGCHMICLVKEEKKVLLHTP